MGVLESDLPNLPYTLVKWKCMCIGCKGATKLRDYGIAPFYYWPVKVVRSRDKAGVTTWRGGWTNMEHGYICSKHFPQYKLDPHHFEQKYTFKYLQTTDPEKISQYLMSKIKPIKKSKLYKNEIQS